MTLAMLFFLGATFLAMSADVEDKADDVLTRANNTLAFDLYAELRTQEGNLLFSPYSITTALAMVREGARGETAKQMDEVLHVRAGSLGAPSRELAKALQPPEIRDEPWKEDSRRVPAYELSVANALWGQQGVTFEEPFLTSLEREFGAPMERIDFQQTAEARKRINRWVEERTQRRIRDIVPPSLPTPDTRLALANAIYFKAQWKDPFSESRTQEKPFTVNGDRTVTARMMRQTGDFGYAETEEAQLLELGYRGAKTSMVIVLPKERKGLPALEEKLDAATLSDWLGRLVSRQVSVELPRFEFTSTTPLAGTLAELGMRDAFDPQQADLTGMTDEIPLFVGAVLHKAFIAVDEEGTEAAAATAVLIALGSIPDTPVPFVADHPFLFLIRHRETGCFLFLGRVVDPTRE